MSSSSSEVMVGHSLRPSAVIVNSNIRRSLVGHCIGASVRRYPSKNLEEYLDASGLEEIEFHIMRYAMIIEPGERNYSAYLPDLPGCIATGKTIDELRERMSEAIELHLQGMREDGLPIPEPTSLADYVEAA